MASAPPEKGLTNLKKYFEINGPKNKSSVSFFFETCPSSVVDPNKLNLIRIQNFDPIWILIRIQGYVINFERREKIKNNLRGK